MLSRFLHNFKKFDWILFFVVILLVSFGLAAIYSVALSKEAPDFFYFKKQIIAACLGLVVLLIASFIDYKFLCAYSLILYLIGALFLVAVLVLGQTLRGTTGWFSILGINFQPVEIAKICLIIFLAYYFSKNARQINKIKHIFVSGFFTFFLVILVLLQPDFGSAMVLLSIWLGMILIIGIKRFYMASMVVLLIIAVMSAWFFVFQEYQKERILTFIDPARDPLGQGYNVTQSSIAVGAGGLFGKGLGFGSQSQLRFLPETHTDFVFSVLAEELGFAGICLFMIFWIVFFHRIILISKRASDDFSLYLGVGAILMFFTHLFINIGMNIGLAPVTGITLPFISAGGSSLIISFLIIGVLQQVAMKRR